MKTIGVFGGSFNPIHNGHLLALNVFKRELALDTILLIPAGTPPHKPLAPNSPDAQTRLFLTKLAVQNLSGVEVSDIEVARKGKSFTYDTLCELKQLYPNDKLVLLMGTDMFLSFEEWHRYKEIFFLAEIAVMPRSLQKQSDLEHIQALAAHFSEKFHARIHILSTEYIELSSTHVRRMLFFDCADDYVPKSILDAIQKSGFYRPADCRGLSLEELKMTVDPLYEPRRYSHAVGCCETAMHLAEKYGADPSLAARAGILHDITKALGKSDQIRL